MPGHRLDPALDRLAAKNRSALLTSARNPIKNFHQNPVRWCRRRFDPCAGHAGHRERDLHPEVDADADSTEIVGSDADRRLSHGKRAARGAKLKFRCFPTGSRQARRMDQIGVGANSLGPRAGRHPSDAVHPPTRTMHTPTAQQTVLDTLRQLSGDADAAGAALQWIEAPDTALALALDGSPLRNQRP